MKSLGTPQHLMWLTYLDCKKRTKKEIKFPKETKGISHDEELVHFILENSSITERQGERSYHRVYDAIDVICKQLCPGHWCTRTHCKNYSRRHAYNCNKTRPTICKEYKAYIKKKQLRSEKDNV